MGSGVPSLESSGHSISTMDYATFILNEDLVDYPDFATSVYDSGAETPAASPTPTPPPAEAATPYAALARSHFKLSRDVRLPSPTAIGLMSRMLLPPGNPLLRNCRLLLLVARTISRLLPSLPLPNVLLNASCPNSNSTNPTLPPPPSSSILPKNVPAKSVVPPNPPPHANPLASPNIPPNPPNSLSVANSSQHTVPQNVSHLPPNPNVPRSWRRSPNLVLLPLPSKSNLRMMSRSISRKLRRPRRRGGNLLPRDANLWGGRRIILFLRL